jgi:hypothetical protein
LPLGFESRADHELAAANSGNLIVDPAYETQNPYPVAEKGGPSSTGYFENRWAETRQKQASPTNPETTRFLPDHRNSVSRRFELMPAAAMPRLFLNFFVRLLLFQDGKFSVLGTLWMNSFFIYERGIKFLSLFSGWIFSVCIGIHSLSIHLFRRLLLLIFSIFRDHIQTGS